MSAPDPIDSELEAIALRALGRLNRVYELACTDTHDGAPAHPTPNHLARMAVDAGITTTITDAAQYVESLQTTGRLVAYEWGGLGPFLCRPGRVPTEPGPTWVPCEFAEIGDPDA
jgi:hypothetical protein